MGRLKGVPECLYRPPGGPEMTDGGPRERSCLVFANTTGCLPTSTWVEAKDECERHGARLCTRDELPVAKGTGCGLDDEYVWVWESCDHSHAKDRNVAAYGGNNRNYFCDFALRTHFVRCCADCEGEVCNGPLPTPAPTSLPLWVYPGANETGNATIYVPPPPPYNGRFALVPRVRKRILQTIE